MGQEDDDLALRIDEANRARRQLERSVGASGIRLRRALSRDGAGGDADREVWPRPVKRRSPWRYYSAAGVLALLSALVLLAVLVERRRPVAQEPRQRMAVEPVLPARAEAAAVPFVIHVRATRSCRVRMVVDGEAQEWRELEAGDEFVSRPREEMVLQSDDGGALSATVNGKLISLGSGRQPIAIRFTPEVLRQFVERAAEP